MVREFELINEKGQKYSLMDIENYCLLTDPSGLGISYLTEYEQIGNTFINNLRKIEYGKINGVVNFKYYDNYKNLVDFIESSENLKFSYKVPFENGYKEYLKDVNLQLLTKTQKQPNGIISESVIFECLTLWYEQTTAIFTIEPKTNELRWDYEWDSKFVDYDTRSLQYINKGHVEAPIIVEINGHVINPYIELYIEGQLYQTVRFPVEIEQYEKLLYGTKENGFYIKKQHTDGTLEDLFKGITWLSEFSNDNVIRIPKNKSCELRLKADNEILNAQVIILSYYKAV